MKVRFWTALRALGSEAETAGHAGSNPLRDVHGARASRLRAVQIVARGADAPPTSPAPDRTIAAFDGLPAAILARQEE